MWRICSLAVAAVSFPVLIWGQTANTTHVFPQVVDGVTNNGGYGSLMWITNLSGGDANCTLSLYGMSTSRLATPSTFNLLNGTFTIAVTRAESSLVTGYGKLTCTRPVTASLLYAQGDSLDRTTSMATVFSAPSTTYAHLPMLLIGGLRYGVAIANDLDTAIDIAVTYIGTDGQIRGRSIQIPAKSQYVRFADEIVSLPTDDVGHFELLTQSGRFHITALMFDGTVFTTLVPTLGQ